MTRGLQIDANTNEYQEQKSYISVTQPIAVQLGLGLGLGLGVGRFKPKTSL